MKYLWGLLIAVGLVVAYLWLSKRQAGTGATGTVLTLIDGGASPSTDVARSLQSGVPGAFKG